jgi:hypothetical protein
MHRREDLLYAQRLGKYRFAELRKGFWVGAVIGDVSYLVVGIL